jgi:glycosyltransferase involved in cell wall biosynthesis
MLLGPARAAPSGVATHLNQLFASSLASKFELSHFQVGSEGRTEGRLGTFFRLAISPFSLSQQLLRSHARIVHINTSMDAKAYWRDLTYLAVCKLLRRKVVYQVHGGALPAEFSARSRVLRGLLRRTLYAADAVVVLASIELRAYSQFAPGARVIHIANAVVTHAVNSNGKSREVSERPLEVVYVGRLAVSKGILETVQAVEILRNRGIAVHLRIAGSGPARPQIESAITSANLGDRVSLVGEIFGERKSALWHQADVLALPSYCEGLPYALLESMACGVVPVTSPVGGIPDVVEDQVHGFLVPNRDPQAVADALARLAGDRSLLRRLAQAAHRRIAEAYSVPQLEMQFKMLYESLA